jgi:SAM-dependent methyltransferase
VLEVGCGSGRFTQIILDAGAEVFSVDYSSAVDVNIDNNGTHNNGIHPRLNIFQADLYALPFLADSFDKILCLGVLQHTPDTKGAFLSLPPYLRAGGELVIDVYARSWETYFTPKYWLRPMTKRIPERFLYSIIQRTVPVLLPIKTRVRRCTPKVGRYLAGMVPVANYYGAYDLTDAQQRQWSILDTFDALSPEYDNPQRIKDVMDWFTEAGLGDTAVDFVSMGIIRGKGTRPDRKREMSG